MSDTSLPEIPVKYTTKEGSDLYWEVSEMYLGFSSKIDHYSLVMIEEFKVLEEYEEFVLNTEMVNNPKHRWWNSEPKLIRKSDTERIPKSRIVTRKNTIYSEKISQTLDFTSRDVYNLSKKMLRDYEVRYMAGQLIGKYPPKTLELD